MSNISVSDPTSFGDLPDASLAPGANETCTGTTTHTVTQSDVDAGPIHDTAMASGLQPATLTNPSPTPTNSPQGR